MGGYPRIPLAELCEVDAGPSASLLENLHEGPDGVPVIAPPNITEQHTIDTKRLRRIPEADAEKLRRFAVMDGDILFVRQGALGRLAVIQAVRDMWLYSPACLRMRPRTKLILPAYLSAFLSYGPVQKDIMDQALPGTVPSLSTALLRKFPIMLPPIDLQWQIADMAADISNVINIQRKITERFEALKQAIFGEMIYGREHACRD
jgi:type I restriction enzyme, S subunit